MDLADARALVALNNRFYRVHAASFSATRGAPWQGWARVADELAALDAPLHVADVAAGNMRLARYLAETLPHVRLDYHAFDACDALAASPTPTSGDIEVSYHHLDILETLLAQGAEGLARALREGAGDPLDAACCFGFMHHVPGETVRRSLIEGLVRATRPGGMIALSFWQFMDDERLAAKARATTALACDDAVVPALDENDYLLGWQDDPVALRYCHHTDDAEIDRLAAHVAEDAREICRFSADGRTARLNRYLILQRR